MNSLIAQLSWSSIVVAVIIGWVRFRKSSPEFRPFLYILTIGFINELISYYLLHNGHWNVINTNIYCLIEALFIAGLFWRWKLYSSNIFIGLVLFYLTFWITETLLVYHINRFSSYFIVGYSSITVLLTVSYINTLVWQEGDSLIRNPAFIICIGFVIYYTYVVLIELFHLYGFDSTEFSTKIYGIHSYINLLCNLIYAVAFLWIPSKREFIRL
ncbi:MAG TPA: hypothetical protein VM843_08505 [Flavisolibacter sp.]|nr:hypothetical protein [Flavisolibacter sp.]